MCVLASNACLCDPSFLPSFLSSLPPSPTRHRHHHQEEPLKGLEIPSTSTRVKIPPPLTTKACDCGDVTTDAAERRRRLRRLMHFHLHRVPMLSALMPKDQMPLLRLLLHHLKKNIRNARFARRQKKERGGSHQLFLCFLPSFLTSGGPTVPENSRRLSFFVCCTFLRFFRIFRRHFISRFSGGGERRKT